MDENNGNVTDVMQTVMLDDFGRNLYIGTSSVIGRREYQQDAIKADDFYAYIENNKAICVLCDGMGGLSCGEKASSLCSSTVFDTFHSEKEFPSVSDFYKYAILKANEEVCGIETEDNERPVGAGTTLCSIVVENDNLFWASVGDSRIYIIRNNEMLCITNDHNFKMLLDEKVKNGEITQEEAENNPKKDALISFIGIGQVRYVDINNKPFRLINGDVIILCSDGLYRSVSEEEIKGIVKSFEKDTQQTAEALTDYALSKNNKNQDNTSVIVVRYEDSG